MVSCSIVSLWPSSSAVSLAHRQCLWMPLLFHVLLLASLSFYSTDTSQNAHHHNFQDVNEEDEHFSEGIQRHARLFPSHMCKMLILLAEEEWQQPTSHHSTLIDQQPHLQLQPGTIEIYSNKQRTDNISHPKNYRKNQQTAQEHEELIGNVRLWNILRPYLPRLAKWIMHYRSENDPMHNLPRTATIHTEDSSHHTLMELRPQAQLNRILLRKYSSHSHLDTSTTLSFLSLHSDSSRNTIMVELGDDYVGGGWFYYQPPPPHSLLWHFSEHSYPTPPKVYLTHEWLRDLQRNREHDDDIVFPILRQGDAVLYNVTLFHGVAPIQSGNRYAMEFFFDVMNTNNQAGEGETDNNDETSVDSQVGDTIPSTKGWKVEFYNDVPDVEIDIVSVTYAKNGEERWEEVYNHAVYKETFTLEVFEGEILMALVARTNEIVSTFQVSSKTSPKRIVIRREVGLRDEL